MEESTIVSIWIERVLRCWKLLQLGGGEGFTQMTEEYGEWNVDQSTKLLTPSLETDVPYLKVFGSRTIVLSKAEPVPELLEKRSGLCSDRESALKRGFHERRRRILPRYSEQCRMSCMGSVALPLVILMRILQHRYLSAGLPGLCHTETGGEHTSAFPASSSVSPLSGDSTLGSLRVSLIFQARPWGHQRISQIILVCT
jgi:hypothetical protein